MRKQFFIYCTIALMAISVQAQKIVRIGYIDMNYILQNVPDYAEANNNLEQKAQKWKQELDAKKNAVNKLKETLKTEKALLTKELIEEREEAIAFEEKEFSDLQEKHFGPQGDYFVQKSTLVKPVQDQVFNAVQDIAERLKFDFIFDKSSDLTMLFGAKRYDLSDKVVKALTKTITNEQRTKKQIKEAAAKEYQQELEDLDPEIAQKRNAKEQRAADNAKKAADRKAAFEAAKKAAAEKKQRAIDERNAKKNGTTLPPANTTTSTPNTANTDTKSVADTTTDKAAQQQTDYEIRKKAIEDRKAKQAADREAALKAKQEAAQKNKEAIQKAKDDAQKAREIAQKIKAEEAKQKAEEAKKKAEESKNKKP